MSHSSHDKEKTDHIDVEKENVEQTPHLRLQHIHDASGVQKVVTVKNAALAAATTQGALRPFSKESLMLYWSCFIAFLCSCANGYDGSLMTSINSMPQYQDKFKTGTLGDTVGLVFSLYNIGGIVGPWFAGPLTDRFGRRGGMFIGAWIIVIGTIIAATSEHLNQFMAGRFILGFGVSILTCAAPSYIIEVSPPQWRGRMTGLYNCGWFGGSIPAAGITLGTQAMAGDMAWRLPLIFQAVPSGVVILAVWFLPESPRWQIANGQDERAMAFLTKYHGNGDPTNPVVELEWKEFKDDIRLDASDKRWWDYSELVKTRGARWRSLMVLMMGIFGQFSGNGLGYFNQQIYEAVGYSTYNQFVLNLGNNFTSCGGAIAGVALADKMPRRKVLIIGTFLSGLMLAANGGLSTKWAQNAEVGVTDLNVGRAAVAFYFFFGIIYSFSYTPLQALYPVECLNTATRAKGMAMYGVVVGLFGFINTYAGPIALKNIREKYIYIFVAWDMVESFLWWLLGIETNGRSLEQLEAIFSSKNPVKASKQTEKLAVKQDGALAVVDE